MGIRRAWIVRRTAARFGTRVNLQTSLVLTIGAASLALAGLGTTEHVRLPLSELRLGEGIVALFPALGISTFVLPLLFPSEIAHWQSWLRETPPEAVDHRG